MRKPVPGDRGLVVLPPHGVVVKVDRWRGRYDANYGIVPPHITVAYPPFVPEEEWPQIRAEVVECLSQFAPFDVRLRGLGSFFSADSCFLWLNVEDDGNLAHIRSRLAGQLPQYVPPLPYEYKPHLTIGIFDSEEELRKAESAVRVQLRPLRFRVTELVCLSPDNRGEWCACDQVPLGVDSGAR